MSSITDKPGPLAGLKVLEIGRLVAAPLCGQILGDLGADVVKVERRFKGDELRAYGPTFVRDEHGVPTQESSGFLSLNRNKRSVTIDHTTAPGRNLIVEMASKADVLIENFKTGTLKRYGLDEATLRAVNPDLIYLSVTGFGQTGPYADRPGTDGVFQAMSGLQSLTGQPDGPPERAGIVMVDLFTGLYSVVAVLSALRHREVNGGNGQAIDMALLDCGVAALNYRGVDYLLTGERPWRVGNSQPGATPSRIFDCIGGPLYVQAGADDHFARFCAALQLDELPEDPRFNSRQARIANEAALNAILEPVLGALEQSDAYERLVRHDVIGGPVYDVPGAFNDPQVRHRDMAIVMPHPIAGTVPLVASPIKMSDSPVTYRLPPPLVGQHTDEVLAEWLRTSPEELTALRDASAI